VAGPTTVDPSVPAYLQHHQQQSVQASDVNSLPLDNMFSVVTVVQQNTTEFNNTVSEEAKIVVITKTV
jgi:hypothetical protein